MAAGAAAARRGEIIVVETAATLFAKLFTSTPVVVLSW
jgi:hypothetical protein